MSGRKNLTLASGDGRWEEDLERLIDCLSFSALCLMLLWMPDDVDGRVLDWLCFSEDQ